VRKRFGGRWWIWLRRNRRTDEAIYSARSLSSPYYPDSAQKEGRQARSSCLRYPISPLWEADRTFIVISDYEKSKGLLLASTFLLAFPSISTAPGARYFGSTFVQLTRICFTYIGMLPEGSLAAGGADRPARFLVRGCVANLTPF
jgi:hypothetical protein